MEHACAIAKTPRETRRAMERIGKKRGANPADWFATPFPVTLSELEFQVYLGNRWWKAEPQAMVEVWSSAREPHPLAALESG
jgi:hypothetical protein